MYYHKIENNWVKAKHSHFSYERERCIKDTPELLCTEIKKHSYNSEYSSLAGAYWKVGSSTALTISKSLFMDGYQISWSRKIRHLHFENQIKEVDGKIYRSLYSGCYPQEVLLKNEIKFSKAVEEALNLYQWLKNDLQIIDNQFLCLDEKPECQTRYFSRTNINEIDLSLHKINFADGLAEVLIA